MARRRRGYGKEGSSSRTVVTDPPVDPATKKRLALIGFEADGKPFEPNQSSYSITLPTTIYSSIFLMPLLIDEKQRGQTLHRLTILLPQILAYIICLTVQISFIFFVRSLTEDIPIPVCQDKLDWYPRVLGLILCVASVYRDFEETIQMILWVRCLPNFDPKIHDGIIEYCCENSGRTSLPFQNWTNPDTKQVVTKPAAGISQAYRFCIYAFVLLPKSVLSVLVLAYGAKNVLAAGTVGDVIANSMAFVFVLDLDDLVYTVLTSPLHKQWVATSSEITVDDDEQNFLDLYQPYIAMFTIAVGSYILMTTYC